MATRRETVARSKYVCPECHAEAGLPCRKRTPFSSGLQDSFHGGPMRGIHTRRKALVTSSEAENASLDTPEDTS